MKPMRTRRRWKLLAELCGLAAVASLPVAADAQAVLPLFDGHIHYSVGATRQYSPEQIVGLLDQAGIRRALLSSTPNDGTRELFRLYPRRFIPELRPYRKTRDLASWSAERASWHHLGARRHERAARDRRPDAGAPYGVVC